MVFFIQVGGPINNTFSRLMAGGVLLPDMQCNCRLGFFPMND